MKKPSISIVMDYNIDGIDSASWKIQLINFDHWFLDYF